MIITEILADGRTHTYSDKHVKILQDTGILYDDAVDTVPHTYTETGEPIESEELDPQEALDLIFGGAV